MATSEKGKEREAAQEIPAPRSALVDKEGELCVFLFVQIKSYQIVKEKLQQQQQNWCFCVCILDHWFVG